MDDESIDSLIGSSSSSLGVELSDQLEERTTDRLLSLDELADSGIEDEDELSPRELDRFLLASENEDELVVNFTVERQENFTPSSAIPVVQIIESGEGGSAAEDDRDALSKSPFQRTPSSPEVGASAELPLVVSEEDTDHERFDTQETVEEDSTAATQFVKKILDYENLMRLLQTEHETTIGENMKLKRAQLDTVMEAAKGNDVLAQSIEKLTVELLTVKAELHGERSKRHVVENELKVLKEGWSGKERTTEILFQEISMLREELKKQELAREAANGELDGLRRTTKEKDIQIEELSGQVDRLEVSVAEWRQKTDRYAESLQQMIVTGEDDGDDNVDGDDRVDRERQFELELHRSRQECKLLTVQVEELRNEREATQRRLIEMDSMMEGCKLREKAEKKLREELDDERKKTADILVRAQRWNDSADRLYVLVQQREDQIQALQRRMNHIETVENGLNPTNAASVVEQLATKLIGNTSIATTSSLVAELVERMEAMILDRRRCQQVVDSMAADILLKDALLRHRSHDTFGELRKSEEQLQRQVQRLEEQNEKFAEERDELRDRLWNDLSFNEPILQSDGEDETMNASMERTLYSATDLIIRSQKLESKLEMMAMESPSPARTYFLDETASSSDEGLRQIVDDQKEEIRELEAEVMALKDQLECMELLRSQVEQLETMWKHESASNAELRVLLMHSEQVSAVREKTYLDEVGKLEQRLKCACASAIAAEVWTRNLGRNVLRQVDAEVDASNGMSAFDDSTEIELVRGTIDGIVRDMVHKLDELPLRQRREERLQEGIASLQVQKALEQQVRALRGELPVGTRHSDEYLSSPRAKLRAGFVAVLAFIRLRRSVPGGTGSSLVDIPSFFSVTYMPPVWRAEEGEMSRKECVLSISGLKMALKEQEKTTEELTKAVAGQRKRENESGEMNRQNVARLVMEKRMTSELLQQEIERSTQKRDELTSKVRRAQNEVEMEQRRADAEKAARLLAEKKVRSYVVRLEEYVTAFQRMHAEKLVRDRSFKETVMLLREKVEEAEATADLFSARKKRPSNTRRNAPNVGTQVDTRSTSVVTTGKDTESSTQSQRLGTALAEVGSENVHRNRKADEKFGSDNRAHAVKRPLVSIANTITQ